MIRQYVKYLIKLDRLSDSFQFGRYLPAIYPHATDLVARDLSPEARSNLKDYFTRVGQFQGILERS